MTSVAGTSGPLGIFDSGVGGLTVLQAMRRRLPGESFLYLGDTARLPYGTKSASTVKRYALNAARHLVGEEVRLLVVACNTATAFALEEVAASVSVPVIGVVEPGVETALSGSVQRIGVIGTEGTIRSGAYQRALVERSPSIEVKAVACPLFVPLAEEGWGDHPVTDTVAQHYLGEILDWGAEALILGCTHYPLLTPSLGRVAGDGVQLVDSASTVAEAVISRHGDLLNCGGQGSGDVTLRLTDASERFIRITRTILGQEPVEIEVVDL